MVLAVIPPTSTSLLIGARVARFSLLIVIVPLPTSHVPSRPWRPIRQRFKDNAHSSQNDLPAPPG